MSLMDDLLSAANTLSDIADTPRAAVTSALMGENPFEAAFDTSKRRSGRDMLEKWGVLGQNQEGLDEGDVLGFAAEQFMDPLNLIGGSALSKAAKALGKARRTNREIAAFNQAAREANLFRQATRSKAATMAPELDRIAEIEKANAASLAQRAAGHMPEELAKETKVVDEAGKPLKTYHGTPYAFDKLDPNKLSEDSLYGPGYYTTADPDLASSYTTKNVSDAAFEGLSPAARKRAEDLLQLQTKARMAAMDANHDLFKLDIFDDPSHGRLSPAGRAAVEKAATGAINPKLSRKQQIGAIAGNALKKRYNRLLKIAERAKTRTDTLREAGIAPQNVRMQFIHAKKPFDIEAIFDPEEASRLGWKPPHGLSPQELRKELGLLETGNTPLVSDTVDSLAARGVPMGLMQQLVQGEIGLDEAIRSLTVSPRGQEVYDMLPATLGSTGWHNLRKAGYDAITHTGGKITGGKPHKVVIAFDPSQIYKPYIAPALQPIPPRPQLTDIERYIGLRPDVPLQAPVSEPHRRAAALLAALLAHNAVRNTADYQQVP